MRYKSFAPKLSSSCYNCHYFQLSNDMLNGFCTSDSLNNKKSAIGIGTCDLFSAKQSSDFDIQALKPDRSNKSERESVYFT